jgi:hypothetical protein
MIWLYVRLLPFFRIYLRQYLLADQTRALRDALHNVVREGVEAASLRSGPSLEEVYGAELLVDRTERQLFGLPDWKLLKPKPKSPAASLASDRTAVASAPPPPTEQWSRGPLSADTGPSEAVGSREN